MSEIKVSEDVYLSSNQVNAPALLTPGNFHKYWWTQRRVLYLYMTADRYILNTLLNVYMLRPIFYNVK